MLGSVSVSMSNTELMSYTAYSNNVPPPCKTSISLYDVYWKGTFMIQVFNLWKCVFFLAVLEAVVGVWLDFN